MRERKSPFLLRLFVSGREFLPRFYKARTFAASFVSATSSVLLSFRSSSVVSNVQRTRFFDRSNELASVPRTKQHFVDTGKQRCSLQDVRARHPKTRFRVRPSAPWKFAFNDFKHSERQIIHAESATFRGDHREWRSLRPCGGPQQKTISDHQLCWDHWLHPERWTSWR